MSNSPSVNEIPVNGITDEANDLRLLGSGRLLPQQEVILEKLAREAGLGALKSQISSTYSGINHRGSIVAVPPNQDQYGLTFFTRPRMNLSYDNLVKDRTFTPMLSAAPHSVARVVRAYLDPVGAKYRNYGSPLVDEKQAFIPLLGNTLISLSGWPDPYVDTYTSPAGIYKEEWAMVDGYAKIYNSYELTANFKNIVDDPITYLFHIWTQYMALVHEGVMDPYFEHIIQNEIDYQTRIYRLVLDKTRRYVQKIAACGAGFPTSSTLGSIFDYASDKAVNDSTDQISVRFKCMGAMYLDPILVSEFNEVVCIFNPDMVDGRRRSTMTQIPGERLTAFNNMGYPRIDPDTSELQWFLSKAQYNAMK